MKYTKIKMVYPAFPERFCRTVAVAGNPDLYLLGAILGCSVEADFTHYYMFYGEKFEYLPDAWKEYRAQGANEKWLSEAVMTDLGKKFSYLYDTGEGWEFACEVQEEVQIESNAPAVILDGQGAGIFENDHHTLEAWLYGEIDGSMCQDDHENMYFMPQNLGIASIGEFEGPYVPLDMELNEGWLNTIVLTMRGEEEEESVDEESVRKDVAYRIFHDPMMSFSFRAMLASMDFQEAYEVLVQKVLNGEMQ